MENYIGKKIILLVDKPVGGNVKKGDIGIMIRDGVINFPKHRWYSYLNWKLNLGKTLEFYNEEPNYEIY